MEYGTLVPFFLIPITFQEKTELKLRSPKRSQARAKNIGQAQGKLLNKGGSSVLTVLYFIQGKKSTSRMVSEPVNSITILSMPIPIPPVGGIP